MSARDTTRRMRDSTPTEVLVPRAIFIVTVLALALFGLVMVYSASSPRAIVQLSEGTYYVVRQASFIAGSIVVAALVAVADYRWLRGVGGWIVYFFTLSLLVATFLFGQEGDLGGQRWLDLGLISIQPGEFAKLAAVLIVAVLLCDWYERRLDTQQMWLRIAIVTLPMVLLLYAQPDYGSMLLLIGGVLIVLWVGGIDGRSFALLTGGVGVVAAIAAFAAPYRVARILAINPWVDPGDKGYQAINGFYAFATGGLTGVGLGLSRQKYFYLPEAHTDFIFAVVGEELGLIGTLGVLIAFMLLVWSGLQIARHAPDRLGRLVAVGATLSLGLQALLNIGMVVGLLPVTGKTLPFISSGGSSMLASMITAGVVLSVSLRSTSGSVGRRRENMRVVEGVRR